MVWVIFRNFSYCWCIVDIYVIYIQNKSIYHVSFFKDYNYDVTMIGNYDSKRISWRAVKSFFEQRLGII